ncbi:hypothetical protein J4733_06575 [Klebsiella pneumoniae]|uniref:Tr-type G domain-containing protein n=1 Tax=Klebsiella pneumoniae TaxID=573 RepID=A0A939SV21_KLEPN|nr:hypothetical protein [Klebsiella pneumoniae]
MSASSASPSTWLSLLLDRKRKFIIADTPGHEQYTRNMATGASTCDTAILLIDARKGCSTRPAVTASSRRCWALNTVVAVNKMDLVEFSEALQRDPGRLSDLCRAAAGQP